MEQLTHEIAEKAWAHLQEIEELGGMTAALSSGLPKSRIEASAARIQARIDSGRQAIVGVNKYKPEQDVPPDVLVVDNKAVRDTQLSLLQKLNSERDEDAVQAALRALTDGAKAQTPIFLNLR